MNLQKYLDLEALTKLRRDLHQHPELGFEEIRTSRIVADYLLELGLEVEEGIAETGVVATLRGEGRSVGLRDRPGPVEHSSTKNLTKPFCFTAFQRFPSKQLQSDELQIRKHRKI